MTPSVSLYPCGDSRCETKKLPARRIRQRSRGAPPPPAPSSTSTWDPFLPASTRIQLSPHAEEAGKRKYSTPARTKNEDDMNDDKTARAAHRTKKGSRWYDIVYPMFILNSICAALSRMDLDRALDKRSNSQASGLAKNVNSL